MKIGIDIHGTADLFPDFFRELARLFIKAGHEVHIMTGMVGDRAAKELQVLGISYTHMFSITTWQIGNGTKVTYDEKGNPWMDEETWNRSKAEYAEFIGLDIVLDDSNTYGLFFKTPYMKVEKV